MKTGPKDEEAETINDRRAQGGDKAFKQRLVDTIPHLRAFAYSLCGRMDLADDLVQETMLKAWSARKRFQPDTSMRAWTFVILRNSYISLMRRNKFTGAYDPLAAERILAAPAHQDAPLHLDDVHRALQALNAEQREALILVGAGGFTYDEAAEICGCATGTVKSRVSRARSTIEAMLEATEEGEALPAAGPSTHPDGSMGDILQALELLGHNSDRMAA